jgi:hypothetical protein
LARIVVGRLVASLTDDKIKNEKWKALNRKSKITNRKSQIENHK